ncbi:MAG: aldo/keto reductase, partial [Planctomycetota bacterium]
GKFDRARFEALAPDDHRKTNPDFLEPQFSATLELVEDSKKITQRNGRTCSELAISWVLRRPEITAAIVGARSPQQIIETAPAADWEISEKDIKQIELLLNQHRAKLDDRQR